MELVKLYIRRSLIRPDWNGLPKLLVILHIHAAGRMTPCGIFVSKKLPQGVTSCGFFVPFCWEKGGVLLKSK
jgi:hypothetical protein